MLIRVYILECGDSVCIISALGVTYKMPKDLLVFENTDASRAFIDELELTPDRVWR